MASFGCTLVQFSSVQIWFIIWIIKRALNRVETVRTFKMCQQAMGYIATLPLGKTTKHYLDIIFVHLSFILYNYILSMNHLGSIAVCLISIEVGKIMSLKIIYLT